MTNSQLLLCAELCVESYSDTCPPDFHDVQDLRYGVRIIDGTAYVTLRGTANALNVMRDIWVRPSRICTGEWVHKGFASGFESLCCHIKMADAPAPIPFVFTGHSFGASVALLLADLTGFPCVTFGCPRPYLRFNGKPNPQHVRVRTDDDPVTMIPRIFYHLPEPGREIVLCDRDRDLINVDDHSMVVYRRRLEKWLKRH